MKFKVKAIISREVEITIEDWNKESQNLFDHNPYEFWKQYVNSGAFIDANEDVTLEEVEYERIDTDTSEK